VEDLAHGPGNRVIVAGQRYAGRVVEIRVTRDPGGAAFIKKLSFDDIKHAEANIRFDGLDVKQNVGVGDVVIARLTGVEGPTGDSGVLVGPNIVPDGRKRCA